jgi:YHS domain-containing protein
VELRRARVVLGGYDVVAYHTQGKPVRGRSAFTGRYEGGTFYFSSQENLAAFEKQPARYAPRFGGFCAFGVAANKARVPVDPATFKIQNGELLLFFNDMYEGKKVNTKPLWEENPDKLYQDATATWPTLE